MSLLKVYTNSNICSFCYNHIITKEVKRVKNGYIVITIFKRNKYTKCVTFTYDAINR